MTGDRETFEEMFVAHARECSGDFAETYVRNAWPVRNGNYVYACTRCPKTYTTDASD